VIEYHKKRKKNQELICKIKKKKDKKYLTLNKIIVLVILEMDGQSTLMVEKGIDKFFKFIFKRKL
jgi:hypothetical protein